MNGSEITPAEARAVLDLANAPTIARRQDRTRLARGLILSGVITGIVLLAVRATLLNPDVSRSVQIGGMVAAAAVYLAGLGLAQVLYNRVTTRPRGFAVAYLGGLLGTMALYVLTVVMMAIASNHGHPWPWVLVITMAVVTMLPAALAAQQVSTLDAR